MDKILSLVMFVVVIASSSWVLSDAKSIGVRRGQIRGFADFGPRGWFIATLLFWIVAFPLYLVQRPKYKAINSPAPTNTRTAMHSGTSQEAPGHIQGSSMPVQPIASPKMGKAYNTTWGVIMVVSGLCIAGYSGWQDYNAVVSWNNAQNQITSLSNLTQKDIDDAKSDAQKTGNFAEVFVAGMLSSPAVLAIAKANAQSEMDRAIEMLEIYIPTLLVGLALIRSGNNKLRRA
jgi:hypothetical protein